jgi:hypothetical protein
MLLALVMLVLGALIGAASVWTLLVGSGASYEAWR